uniref:Tetratricopeptide repeat protein n=1 Tax=Desulfobacca acetoxidans TaxID=60893 RepID=A0A7C3ZAT9_9BACT
MRWFRGKRLRRTIFIPVAALVGAGLLWAGELAGRLVYIEGQVAVRPAGTDQWQKARLHQDLSGGDTVRTGAYSRAAILCLDESQIRLNQHTVLTLKSVAPSPRLRLGEIAPAAQAGEALSNYQVIQGEIWLRNKKEKFLFELETPTVTATIRGTELNVRVQADGATSVVLLEGEVKLANRYGQVTLTAGEEGLVLPGKAPTKQVLVQPADAVQWSLYYPGYFSYRDLPLQSLEGSGVSGRSALLSQGLTAYDQGRLAEAADLAGQALAQDPRNPQALTLAGWARLQRRQPEEALGFFQRVTQPGAAATVGTALARYQTGDAVGAYLLMKEAVAAMPGNPVVRAMTGYFAMLLGRTAEARQFFRTAAAGSSPVAQLLATCYLAQMDLVQNRQAEARSQAERALNLAPASPLALLTRALVDISAFQLPLAQQRLEKALETDPRFLDAALYLGRIYLGGNYFVKARRLADQALKLAPHDGRVLSLAGFVDVAFRRYEKAKELFVRAIKESPQLGEAHLGLAICQFRFKDMNQGLSEMLTATLLEPRLSAYQSELGKAFYQVRAFDKALATWDYAAQLDPKDPTPHFYKGIALTDLNRPGEAVQSINESIGLNNNRAVFRSRLLLERDQSTRNYNLARAYSQLGLGEWALSRAVTAVKLDPLNATPHLFLSRAFLAANQRVVAANSEELLYRVLSPANQNTFRYILENDYTAMFEMPYARATVQGGLGSWEERKAIHEDFAAAYGGLPGAAFFGRGDYDDDRGFRGKNGFNQTWNAEGIFKGEPMVQGNLTGYVQYNNQQFGDLTALNDYFYKNQTDLRENDRFQVYELSYLHRFTPNLGLLAFYSFHRLDLHRFGNFLDYLSRDENVLIRTNYFGEFRNYFHNLQLQGQLILGNHTILGGYDYLTGPISLSTKLLQHLLFPVDSEMMVLPLGEFYQFTGPIDRTYTLYLLDYWRLTPWMLVELGVFRDVARNASSADSRTINNSLWSPRLGLNIQIGPKHIMRLGLMRYLDTHQILAPLLVPTEVGGLPWVEDVLPGAEVRQAGASWEAQWNKKTFSVLRFAATRASIPRYFPAATAEGTPYNYIGWRTWRRYEASLFANRILTNWLGLRMGVIGKRVFPDQSFKDELNLNDYTEVNWLTGLSFLTRQGWQGGITNRLVHQYVRDRSAELFDIVNLRFGKELARKRGLITVEVQNLFNRHFYYRLEPSYYVYTPDFYPARRIIGKVQLWF